MVSIKSTARILTAWDDRRKQQCSHQQEMGCSVQMLSKGHRAENYFFKTKITVLNFKSKSIFDFIG